MESRGQMESRRKMEELGVRHRDGMIEESRGEESLIFSSVKKHHLRRGFSSQVQALHLKGSCSTHQYFHHLQSKLSKDCLFSRLSRLSNLWSQINKVCQFLRGSLSLCLSKSKDCSIQIYRSFYLSKNLTRGSESRAFSSREKERHEGTAGENELLTCKTDLFQLILIIHWTIRYSIN